MSTICFGKVSACRGSGQTRRATIVVLDGRSTQEVSAETSDPEACLATALLAELVSRSLCEPSRVQALPPMEGQHDLQRIQALRDLLNQ